MKKKGSVIILFISIGLFVSATFLLVTEYVAYQQRIERYGISNQTITSKTNANVFTDQEINTLKTIREQRNILLGYEAFLNESAINYTPGSFSYGNLLKEKIKTELQNSKYSQSYWDTLFDSFFNYFSSDTKTPLDTYNAIFRISSEYVNEDLDGEENIQVIENISDKEYWQNEILDLDRSPENIETIWSTNKVFFYTLISKSKYETLFKKVISDLIEVNIKITQEPNYKEFYKKYNVSDSIFYTFPSTKYVKKYNYSWPFSFWDRRITEKNDEITLKIIKEIKNHYEN
jgi:hypothetical protein